MDALAGYIPEDRRQAMARGETLPDRTVGSALFADLSGFTPMTEALTRAYGPHRGAEELTRQLGLVFGALIKQVDDYRGAVIGFSGDAITCWFDADVDGLRATAASLAMQTAMAPFADIPLARGERASLRVKTAVVIGPVRRFLVGDPNVQVIDAVAGSALDLLAEAERKAESGEVVVADTVAPQGGGVSVREWRESATPGRCFGVVTGLRDAVPTQPWPPLADDALPEADLASWVLPGVYERLRQGLGAFMADFRPAGALFLSFHGIDYDGDDAAGEKLDRFVRWVQERVVAYEGSLVQLTIGDKGSSYMYASFGAPIAHDDDAARAVAAALEIRALGPGLEFVKDLRIGVTHGQMYAGAYGSPTRRTYGVLGAKTNLSARLMGKAEPGQILCDEEIARRAGRTFDFTSLGTIKVKGKTEGVPIFAPRERTVSVVANDDVAATPLIGRHDDVATLEAVLEEVRAGTGHVTFVEGEAGIGKSRLVQAVVHSLRDSHVSLFQAGAQSGAQQMPYRVWRDVFTAYFGLDASAGLEERAARVRARVEAAAPHLAAVAPLLNDLMPLEIEETAATQGMPPPARQEALSDLLVTLLRSAASTGPLAIVLEDAHWLDSLSWDLAERLARTLLAEGLPLWLLLVHRPLEEQHVGARAAEGLRALHGSAALQLAPLAPEELVALVAARLGLDRAAIPGAVADLMRERANGNPFIAEELVQTLQDQALLSVEDEGGIRTCRISAQLERGEFSLPDTLQGLILSRLDRLPADRQLVLKVAAVIGRLFTMAPLRDTLGHLGWGERALKPSLLRELTRRGFVVPEALAPEISYLFRHLITHEIVYQTLLFSQRRQVHQALAEWYERAFPKPGRDLTPVFAHHWSRAAEGSEAAPLIEKAIHYLVLAGDQAADLGAFPEALVSFERGLALVPSAERWSAARARLMIKTGNVRQRTGDFTQASDGLREGLALARQAEDLTLASQALTILAYVEQRQGHFPAAERYLLEALGMLETLENRAELARVWEALGLLSAQTGQFDEATQRLESALSLHDEMGSMDGVSATLNNLGIVSLFRTDFAAAGGYFERALAIARERGDREGVQSFLSNLGYVTENQGDFERAQRYLREALDIARELNARHSIINTTVNLAHVDVGLGNPEAAEQGYRSALRGALEIGALPIALEAVCGLAVLDHRAGRSVRAAERLGLIQQHPAYNADVAHRADPLLAELKTVLAEGDLAVALGRGAATALENDAALA